jgi:pyruvate dehydrogenase E1 component alpha subunit
MALGPDHPAQFPAQAEPPPEPLRILGPDGRTGGDRPPIDDDEVLDALRTMMLARSFDARSFALQRQGRFGTVSPTHGQEATLVGAALALDPARDWIVPQYRELPALLTHGLPLETFILYFLGHPAGGRIPDGVRVLPLQIGIAAQLPQAVGLAWGAQHRGEDAVVLVFCGDGATSEGDFHEALNLAGVRRAPIVFLVQNNGWAISTPFDRQTATSAIAARAPGYGIPGHLVDGNDLFAVRAVVGQAVERARAGDGPALVECRTFRMGAHNTADDPSRYRSAESLDRWAELDPIARVQRYLVARGRWDDEAASRVLGEVEAEIERALERAWEIGPPGPESIFAHVFADLPQRVHAQRAAMEGMRP